MKNTSPVTGKEVVQLYTKPLISSIVVPNISLRGFNKIEIKAGESKTVDIEIDVHKALGLWNLEMKYVVEPGEFVIVVGSSSLDLRLNTTLTVT